MFISWTFLTIYSLSTSKCSQTVERAGKAKEKIKFLMPIDFIDIRGIFVPIKAKKYFSQNQ